mgnify:CR=1 FL=1
MIVPKPKGGYVGKYARVNLTTGKVLVEELDLGFAKSYLGGTGFAARILWDELSAGTDPLGPENKLIFATGPMTGTMAQGTGRITIAAKSPLTLAWGEANSGGEFAPELKFAGFDFLIIEGRSPKPVYLYVEDGKIEIKDARDAWGRTVSETFTFIREVEGDESLKIACIGPAGENLVRYAAIMTNYHDAAGRTGMGAVMGSKNLKAVAVKGTGAVEVADPDKYFEVVREFFEMAKNGLWAEAAEETLGKYGTPSLVLAEQEIGRLPTKNHYTGVYEKAEDISGEALVKQYRVKRSSCFGCFINCKYYSYVKRGKFAGTLTGGPEYESIAAFGSYLLNPHLDSIIHVNKLCNEYGMDTISAGGTIAWAMECYEKGLITEEDTGGLELKWGDYDVVVKLIHMIAKREGFGDLLAEGSRLASKKIGRGTERYAIHVKGLEMSAQDGRAQKSIGLGHAVNVRGADHLKVLSCYEELGFLEPLEKRFGKENAPKIADRLSIEAKALVTVDCEDFYALVDSLIVCKYGTMWPPMYYFEDFAKILPPLTGIEEFGSVKYLRLLGARIHNLRKAFNVREGLARKDDTLPERLLKEPMPDGPAKGHVVELEPMLNEYYQLRGWDVKTGLQKRETLEKLGLKDVADQLEKMGKLA